jgi:hypothetical protein
MKIRLLLVLSLSFLTVPSRAQAPEWSDPLLDHLAGMWTMTGNVMGNDAHHEVRAEWILNHQFLRIHEKTSSAAPKSEHPYEAIWFLGYDSTSERYVLHLMDVFGGRFSETLGYGTRDANQLRFTFEYPDGPFHTTFRWNSDTSTWDWLMEQKDKSGKWTSFATLKLTKSPTS